MKDKAVAALDKAKKTSVAALEKSKEIGKSAIAKGKELAKVSAAKSLDVGKLAAVKSKDAAVVAAVKTKEQSAVVLKKLLALLVPLFVRFLVFNRKEAIAYLKAQAEKTETPIDDLAVSGFAHALEILAEQQAAAELAKKAAKEKV